MTLTAYERILDRLEGVRANGSRTAVARCPAHEDRNPSLSLRAIEGQVLLYCHAGCDTQDVLAAIEMSTADMFDEPRGASYRYDDGRTVHRSPDKKFSQAGNTNGARTTLYRLAKVIEAVQRGETILLVEGEKDVLALEALGVVATTAPMGAANFDKVDASPLHGAEVIAILDNDEKGETVWTPQVIAKLEGKAKSLDFAMSAVGKDISDHIAAGLTLAEIVPWSPEVGDDPLARFRRIDWHQLWADEESEDWILFPLLPARRLVALFSAAKVGKSLLMLEIAVGLSLGTKVLGHEPGRRHKVLYVDFENDPRGDVRNRLEDMGYGPEDLDHLDYLSFPSIGYLDTPRGADDLMDAVRAYGSEVIVIDTISRIVTGEENSNDTWLDFYKFTGQRIKRAGLALIRLDHTGKDETKGPRGGSAKSGDVDAAWQLTKVTEERLRLECTVSRFPLDVKMLQLVRLSNPLQHEVENLAKLTVREEKVLQLVKLADEAGLPPTASRRDISDLSKAHGVGARHDVYNEVANRRRVKAESALRKFLVPSQETRYDSENTEETSGTTGDHPSDFADSEREKWSPDPRGPAGTTPPPPPVPGPPSVGGDQGTTSGPADLGTVGTHDACATCGRKMRILTPGQTTHPACARSES